MLSVCSWFLAKLLPSLRPNQPTWAVSLPVGCYRLQLHPTLPFIGITQLRGWHSFYHPMEGRRLSQPSNILRWFTRQHAVTHPSNNWAQRTITAVFKTKALLLNHAATVDTSRIKTLPGTNCRQITLITTIIFLQWQVMTSDLPAGGKL